MKRTYARKRSLKMTVAFGAVLITAGCATATSQITDTQVDRGSRYDGGVEQLLLYCGKLHDRGELPTAASICERASNLAPTDARPLIKLGEIFTDMAQLPQAATAYLAVLEQTPHNVEARYLLGKTYIAMGRHDLALQELQFALTQSPEDARIYNALGIANGMLGNPVAAKQAFEEGLKLAPNDVPLRNNLGLALVLGGQHDEGIAMLQKAALDPAATATTIRNLRLAQSIAQSARASQAATAASAAESTAIPGASQLASTATAPSDFAGKPEPVMPEPVMPEPRVETPVAAVSPSQPPAVPREPVMLTQALSPQIDDVPADDIQTDDVPMADSGTPVYLDSGSETDSIAATLAEDDTDASTADAQDNTSPSTEELNLASMPQPLLTPKHETPSGEKPAATGELKSVVTANADTAAPPAVSPSATQTAALVGGAAPGDGAALSGDNVYAVQLASYRSADRAQDGWRQIRASALDLLEDVEPVIRRSDLGPEKGIYFRLRTKPSSKDAANQLCSALQARGLSCLTIKENPVAPAAPAAPAAIKETTTPTPTPTAAKS